MKSIRAYLRDQYHDTNVTNNTPRRGGQASSRSPNLARLPVGVLAPTAGLYVITILIPACSDGEAQDTSSRVRKVMSVTLHTTHGDLKLELFCAACPKTTYNFLALCASGAYNGSPFHRLIPQFMIQGGSPASGSIKDSTSVYGDMFEDEIKPALKHHMRGIVSMANKGPRTNGSQFFVTFAPAAHLDGKNTVFGRVLEGEGWDTLDAMEAVAVDKKNRPQEAIKIESIEIHANPLADER